MKSILQLKNTYRTSIILILIIVLTLSINFIACFQFVRMAPGGNDSIPRWIGTQAWLFEGMNPYSDEVTLRAQQMIYGRPSTPLEDQQKFVYPFYVVWFYVPFVWMNYEWARAIYMMILEIAIILILVLNIRTFKISVPGWLLGITIILGVLNYHSIRTIVLWQLAGISALLITLTLWGIVNKRDVFAGVCLAFASVKPQMTFLVIPILFLWGIRTRRWKISVSLSVTLLLLIVTSFLILPTWFTNMLYQIREYERYTTIGSPVNIITHILFPSLGDTAEILITLLLLGWLLFEWVKVKNFENDEFYWAFSLTLLITNLIVTRTATTNYIMMFPALIYILQKIASSQLSQKNFWILVIELILFIGTWILFLVTVQGREEQWQMYLPFPILILIVLMIIKLRGNLFTENHTL